MSNVRVWGAIDSFCLSRMKVCAAGAMHEGGLEVRAGDCTLLKGEASSSNLRYQRPELDGGRPIKEGSSDAAKRSWEIVETWEKGKWFHLAPHQQHWAEKKKRTGVARSPEESANLR